VEGDIHITRRWPSEEGAEFFRAFAGLHKTKRSGSPGVSGPSARRRTCKFSASFDGGYVELEVGISDRPFLQPTQAHLDLGNGPRHERSPPTSRLRTNSKNLISARAAFPSRSERTFPIGLRFGGGFATTYWTASPIVALTCCHTQRPPRFPSSRRSALVAAASQPRATRSTASAVPGRLLVSLYSLPVQRCAHRQGVALLVTGADVRLPTRRENSGEQAGTYRD